MELFAFCGYRLYGRFKRKEFFDSLWKFDTPNAID